MLQLSYSAAPILPLVGEGFMRKFVPAWSALIVVALLMAFATLIGCGGVSSARPAPTPTPNPTPNPSPTPSPTPTPTPTPAAHGTFVFVGGTSATDGFRFTPDGTMTAIAGSPFPIAGPIASGGTFLFAASGTMVTSFKIDPATGVPAAVGRAAISNAMAITADARNVYVAGVSADGANNVIYGFSVAASGALTPLAGSPYQYTQNCELCDQPDSMAINNSFVIVGGTGFHGVGDFTVYMRAGNGVLGPEKQVGTDEEGGLSIQHPGGNAAYGIDGTSGDIDAFHIDSAGKATGANGFTSVTSPILDEIVDPTGRFLLADDDTGTVHVFTIDPVTANITQAGTSEAAGSQAGQIAMDPTGRFVFLAQSAPAPNQITVFSFDPANGAIKKLQAFPLSQVPGIIVTVTE
jgi:6-phosphogluconolactonase (cycloisomerase 2 family)